MRVLIVEDEAKIADLLVSFLREAGFAAESCARGDLALEKLQKNRYDAAVVDIMLPFLSGLELVRQLRAGGGTVPILMLTALGSMEQRVAGLDAGADDYLAKPFAMKEVIARLRAMGRRSQMAGRLDEHHLHLADLTMDLIRHEARRAGQRLDLSSRELLLLEVLFRHAGHVCSRKLLLEKVWDYHFDQGSNLVDVYIRRLRQKVDYGHEVKLVHTVRGEGYLLCEETHSAPDPAPQA